MKPMGRARQLKQLLSIYTIEELAPKIKLSPEAIQTYLYLLDLCPEGQKLVDEGKISICSGAALSLLPHETAYLETVQLMKTTAFIEYVRKIYDPTGSIEADAKFGGQPRGDN